MEESSVRRRWHPLFLWWPLPSRCRCTVPSVWFFLSEVDGRLTYLRSHAIYPGVLSFYRELDLGTSGVDTWEDGRIGNLAFLSARPHVYKDVSEKKSYAKFQQLYSEKRMHTLPTLLAGCLRSGRAFMMQVRWNVKLTYSGLQVLGGFRANGAEKVWKFHRVLSIVSWIYTYFCWGQRTGRRTRSGIN